MQLLFTLSPELDAKVIMDFLDYQAGGINFRDGLIALHPSLKNLDQYSEEDKKSFIVQYVHAYYESLAHELEEARQSAELQWRIVEGNFFHEVEKYFPNITLPNPPTAYLSIVDCNPRFVHDSSFQFYWEHKMGSTYIACHEIMHFYFFAYIRKVFPETLGKSDTESGALWELSELFNDVLLDTPAFSALYPNRIATHSPDLEAKIDRAKEIWKEKQYVSLWVDAMSKEL